MDYKYRCLDPAGRVITGNIAASDSAEALSLLKGRDLTVVEINEVIARAVRRRISGKKVKDADLYNVFREMSILLKSGIKIDRSLEIIINSSSSLQMRETLAAILKEIKGGKTVSRAFSDTGRFNLLTSTMIHAGESVGDLRSAFENIADYQRFQIQFKGEIKNALAYPSFLIGSSMLVIFV